MVQITVLSPSFSKNILLQDELKKLGCALKLNLDGKRFTKEELIEFIGDSQVIVVGLEQIDSFVLDNCPNLQLISKYGVGLNNIDISECEKRGIKIGWTGGVNRLSVAEMTLGYMLMLTRNLYVTSNLLKQGKWEKSGGMQLSEKTIGIIGLGHIGKELVRLLQPFKCNILVNDIIDQSNYIKENSLVEASKEEIYKTSDIITIHTPFDQTTLNLISKEQFLMMKNSAYVINSARGGIINENDLKFALQNNLIAGAAIDAYMVEPPEDRELIEMKNLICTPHIGGNAKEAVESMGLSAINHVKEFFSL